METITDAAKKYSQIQLNFNNCEITNCDKYDGFLAGATAPETDAYYKRKYGHTIKNCIDDYFDPYENEREEVKNLVASGYLLRAVKYWKETNPGMGLKEAKDYIDSLR